jgi:hypothetical protein
MPRLRGGMPAQENSLRTAKFANAGPSSPQKTSILPVRAGKSFARGNRKIAVAGNARCSLIAPFGLKLTYALIYIAINQEIVKAR